MSLPVPNMQSDELSACKGCLLAKTGCTVNEGTGDIAEVPRRGSSGGLKTMSQLKSSVLHVVTGKVKYQVGTSPRPEGWGKTKT